MKILYEPWGLGDACIAAAVAAIAHDAAVACRTQWHPIIEAAFGQRNEGIKLLSADPTFGLRKLEGSVAETIVQPVTVQPFEVFSIRGDPRDFFAMWRAYPQAKIRMSGWIESLARRNSWLDLLYISYKEPKSRYLQWLQRLRIDRPLELATIWEPTVANIAIHVGAQWKSKQYPHVEELSRALLRSGRRVQIFAGPTDPLPDRILETDVHRCSGKELVETLSNFDLIVTNDSGPMHVCYLARFPFLGIFGTASAKEWAPPGCRFLAASFTPTGYKSLSGYASDKVLSGWPTAEVVMQAIDHNDDCNKAK